MWISLEKLGVQSFSFGGKEKNVRVRGDNGEFRSQKEVAQSASGYLPKKGFLGFGRKPEVFFFLFFFSLSLTRFRNLLRKEVMQTIILQKTM